MPQRQRALKIGNFLDTAIINNFLQGFFSFFQKQNRIGHIIEIIQPYIRGKVLDVGCGTGIYSSVARSEYYSGIDINPSFVIYAKQKYGKNFIVMDATNLAFNDNSFDSVFSIAILHHMCNDDAREAFREMRRVCKPGGNIAIMDAVYPINKFDILGKVLCKIDRGRFMRTIEETRKLLDSDLISVNEIKINKSFPYTLYCFIYKNTK